MTGTALGRLRSAGMPKKRDRWDFWVDLIIPIGAALVFVFSISTIFIDRHHGGTTARAPHQQARWLLAVRQIGNGRAGASRVVTCW